jgi:class 3 adenylate cyclase
VAEAITRISWQTDVRDILPSVHAPALLVVGEGDDPAEAEHIASLMPNATLRVVPGRVTWSLAVLRELAGAEPPKEAGTVLATLLFSDIVGSSERQAAIGDRAWRDLVLAHHSIVREALDRWDGTEHDTAGDGFFASFVGPARAISCGHEITRRVADLGLDTRAGVHIGECEMIDGKPGGLAVTIAARAMATAGAREVIVTRTVKDLVAGSGFTFDDRGPHELKGVPERWPLYAATPRPA